MRGFKAVCAGLLWVMAWPGLANARSGSLEAAKAAYEKGDYTKAIQLLKSAAETDPKNGEIELLLTKAYLESKQYENAVASAEKAVALDPNNSAYHQWLGEADGEKADHAGMLSAYSWARKTQKEFETAVQLDARNFDAAQDLVEYNCTAPGIVGGGEDKAQPVIQKLMSLDAAEGHFAAGVCRAVKKDYVAADAEYAKALENKPKTADRLYDIGDYFQQRGNGDEVLKVAAAGEALAPDDQRSKYYQGIGWILEGQNLGQAEKDLRDYLAAGPYRSTYPEPWDVHYWLGRLQAAQNNVAGAKSEYQEALKLNPKFKRAEGALKQLEGH